MLSFFTGDLDAAYIGVAPFALGRVHGLPIRVIGVAQRLQASDGLVVRRTAATSDLRVGTVLGSTGHMLAMAHAKAVGAQHSCINLNPQDQVRAFAAGFVDAVACWDPYLALAEQAGGDRVFTARDAPFPVHNFIVARDASIATHSDLLLALLNVHQAVATTLAQGPTPEDLSVLSALHGERLTSSAFERILDEGYEWPTSAVLDEGSRECVEDGIRAALHFLRSIGLASTSQEVEPAACTARLTPHDFPRPDAELHVGYSDDLMCAPFNLALHHGHFNEHGIDVKVDEARRIEQVAHFDLAYRTLLADIETLVEVDPTAAVLRIGRASEALFQRVFENRLRTPSPKQLSKTLTRLHDAQIVPPVILTSAHWIRSIRNVAAHADGITRSDAGKACFHLIDILSWWHEVRDEVLLICPNCTKSLAPQWKTCPYCGDSGVYDCQECGSALERNWQNCPHCGATAKSA